MTSGRPIPDTRRGKAYRLLLAAAGLGAVVGIGFAGRSLFWLVLNGPSVSGNALLEFARSGLRLVAWILVAAAAYRGWRRDEVPATWVLVAIVSISWVLILSQP